MQVEGVKGDVKSAGHKGWIQLDKFDWAVSRQIGSPKSAGSDREGQAPEIEEAHIAKINDVASPGLLRLALWGKGKKVEIHFTRTGAPESELPYLKYELEEVLFSDYRVSAVGGRPMEELNLNFTKLTCTNIHSNSNLMDLSPDRVSYCAPSSVGS
jgi:type VI secretion system secreted protein Hcp